MRAVVESSRLTELAGVNADRISMTAWVMSSLLAGLAGILISPTLSQVADIYYTPLVVAAITDGAAPPADTSPDDKSDFGKFLDSLLGREPARAPN